MKKIKDKIASRKFRKIVTVFLLLASFLVVLHPNFVHAVNLEWFEDTKSQTETNKAVDVRENVLGATGSQSGRTVDVRENLQGASTGQTNKTVNMSKKMF